MIKENELKQQRRAADYLNQKAIDAEAIQAIMKTQEEKEKRRIDEKAGRENRIKKIMDSMGEQIFVRDRDL